MSAHSHAEHLLSHTDWLRALARQLVDDPARAEDVAQQTLLEAIERPPKTWSSPRGWLATAARNIAGGFARSDERRRRREHAAARTEAVADSMTVVEKAKLHKDLVECVLSLGEPYQTTLLLRYFEDLPPREIAQRLGRPVDTVRTHLQRGLERMRRQLDDDHEGDRRSWCLAIAPLLRPAQGKVATSALTAGGLFAAIKLLVPTAAAAALVFWLVRDPSMVRTPTSVESSTEVAAVDAGDVAPDVPPTELLPPPTREVIDDAAESSTAIAPEVPLPEFAARLVDLQGRPLPGRALGWRKPRMAPSLPDGSAPDEDSPELDAFTSGDGSFTLLGPENAEQVVIENGWLILGSGELRSGVDGAGELVLLAVRAVAVAGQVVDSVGMPLEGAWLGFHFSFGALPGVAQRLENATSGISHGISTDARGRFAFPSLPMLEFLQFEVRHPGFEVREVAVPRRDTHDLLVRMERVPEDSRMFLSGVVVHSDGRPAERAEVRFGQDSGATDRDGRFEFEVTYVDPHTPLMAVVDDVQPAIDQTFGKSFVKDRRIGRNLRLVLGGAPLEIRGRVVGAGGSPLPGLEVHMLEPTQLGSSDQSVERRLGGVLQTMTGPDGSFVLRGLIDRSYTVRVRDRESFLVLEAKDVPAGTTDLVLREPERAFADTFEGIVVDRHGRALAGVPVDVGVTLKRFERIGMSQWAMRKDEIVTDEHGCFAIPNCPLEHVFIRIGADERVKAQNFVVPSGGGEALRAEVVTLGALRLLPVEFDARDRFEIRDADGQPMQFVVRTPDSVLSTRRSRLAERALAPVIRVEDSAHEVVILRDGKVVRRLPLDLPFGGVHDVEF